MAVERVLFVDLENVQTLDLATIPTNAHVMVFYGIMQKKLPEELVVQAQPLGARLKWIKISGQGPNALDFHIAYYLGQQLTQSPTSECVILSRDTGFDPLVRHLTSLGHSCRRVTTLKDAFSVQSAATNESFSRLLRLLRKEKSRPSKLKGLMGKVKSWFSKLSDQERDALLERLFSESYVQESGASLIYSLDR
ncbi:MAG: PIN domain-containing protein [Steroidobacteraceae bacterium]